MVVYFMKQGKSNYYKIGFTRNLEKRLSSIQSHNPFKITVYHFIKAECSYEKFLHRQYDDCRVKGEWLKFDKKTLAKATSSKMRKLFLKEKRKKFKEEKKRYSYRVPF